MDELDVFQGCRGREGGRLSRDVEGGHPVQHTGDLGCRYLLLTLSSFPVSGTIPRKKIAQRKIGGVCLNKALN